MAKQTNNSGTPAPKSNYEQKYEQKARKKVSRRATLAVLMSIFTLLFVLFAGSAYSSNVNASTVKEQVQDAVSVRMDELMGTPPIQEIMNAGTVDTEVMKDDIVTALTDDVVTKAVAKNKTLNSNDVSAMEQRIREAIEKNLGSSLSNQTLIQQLEQSLGLEEGDLFSEEWFLEMITNVFTTELEQTIVDILSQELDYVYEDINVLEQYIDENLNQIYSNIDNQQTQIANLDQQITNIKETITTLATKEELENVTVQLEALNTELTEYKAQTDLMLSYLENTMAANYDELRAMIESNTARIEELEKRAADNMSDVQSQINNIVNNFNERIEQTESNFTDELNETKNELNVKIDNNKEQTDIEINNIYSELDKKIDDAGDKASSDLEQTKQNIDEQISQSEQKSQENLQTVDEKLTNEIADLDDKTTNQINQSNQQNTDNLNQAANQLTTTINQSNTNLTQNLNNLQSNTLLNLSSLTDFVRLTAAQLAMNTEQLSEVAINNLSILEAYTNAKFAQSDQNMLRATTILNDNIVALNEYLNGEVNTKFNKFAENVSTSLNTLGNNINTSMTDYTGKLKTAFDTYFASTDSYLQSLGTVVLVDTSAPNNGWNSATGTLYLTTKTFTPPTLTIPTYTNISVPTVESVALDKAATPTQVGFDGAGWLNVKDEDGNVVPTGNSPITQAALAKYNPNSQQINEPDYASSEYTSDEMEAPQFEAPKYDSTADAIRDSVTEFDEFGYALSKENTENWNATMQEVQNYLNQQQSDFETQLATKQAELDWYNQHNTKLLQLQAAMYAAKTTWDSTVNDVNVAKADISNNEAGANAAQAAVDAAETDKKNHPSGSDAAKACDSIIKSQTAIRDSYNKSLADAKKVLQQAESKESDAKKAYDAAKKAYDAESLLKYTP